LETGLDDGHGRHWHPVTRNPSFRISKKRVIRQHHYQKFLFLTISKIILAAGENVYFLLSISHEVFQIFNFFGRNNE
jgi:hypothetical protein